MPADRFFIKDPLILGQDAILNDAEFHHLIHVMRQKEGEKIELVNGQGSLAEAIISKIEKKQARLTIEAVKKQEKPLRELILAQALPRINRLDFIIEKGTELGATQFWLFPGFHSERKALTEHQIDRLLNLSIAAMKQCGRLFLPTIEIKPSLEKWEKLSTPSFFGDVRETAPLFTEVLTRSDSTLFFIGPETGFSEKETDRLIQLGSKGVKLHENILRTDTAALVALALMSH